MQCVGVGTVHAGVGLFCKSVLKYLLSNRSRPQWWSCLPLYHQQRCQFSFLPKGPQYPAVPEADRVDQLQVLSVVKQVLTSSQRKDGQFSDSLRGQGALSDGVDGKWASGQKE